MNVLAGLDQLLGAPDGLPVTVDHLARLNPRYRYFVARGNRIEPSLSRPPARLHAVRVYETPDLYVDYFGDAR